ncbi:hypothetical protein HNQ88_004797 [Aureibacter tunicatorum]|uniref:Uncharacterized protein n=1 Tax=Aureibacter tunicatorum TaxID=866807 RepID=A0AAE3XTG6_9BACT|nr:hypothetical protein [Aureibacter tunicatorum]BDD07305.1 hypothetical protein AUTU_47880 [Aureibacter tunicatorum]
MILYFFIQNNYIARFNFWNVYIDEIPYLLKGRGHLKHFIFRLEINEI